MNTYGISFKSACLCGVRAKTHACLLVRVSDRTFSVSSSTLLRTKALACETKATVTVFVLLIKYAHICDIVTRLACRVIARMPVPSPFYPKSCGQSHFGILFNLKIVFCTHATV